MRTDVHTEATTEPPDAEAARHRFEVEAMATEGVLLEVEALDPVADDALAPVVTAEARLQATSP